MTQPAENHPAHRAKRTADLLPDVQRVIDTLSSTAETIKTSSARDRTKQDLLIDALVLARKQLAQVEQLAAVYAVLQGRSQSSVADALGYSHTQVGNWYHSPIADDDLIR